MVLLPQKASNLFKNIVLNDKNPKLNMQSLSCTKFICLLGLLSLAVSSHAQKKYELSVREAVELAFKNLTDVKNAQIDYQLQQAQNKGIEGQVFPQISGTAGFQYYIQTPKILFPDASRAAIY